MNDRRFQIETVVTMSMPEVGGYDWAVYAHQAYEMGLCTVEELHLEKIAPAVIEAMNADYLERRDGCTASYYVKSITSTVREV